MTTRAKLFSQLAKSVDTNGTITSDGISSTVSLGATVYDSIGELPTSGYTAGEQAFVKSTSRLYINSGVGWYNVAVINNTPTIQSILDSDGGTGPFSLATDGTATTITITAQDSDGDALTYTASADSDFNGLATISQVSNVFTITPLSQDSATTSSGTITFSVTDGINIATPAAQTFTLEFLSPLWDNVLYSINVNDQNQIVDTKGNANITLYGDTSPSNAQTKYASSSIYFDGGGDYLTLGNPTLGLTPFTFETWYYPLALGGSILSQGSVSALSVGVSGTMTFQVYTYNNIVLIENCPAGITANQWQHIAFTYTGSPSNTYTIWVNGIAVGTVNDGNTWNEAGGSNPLNVNRYTYNGAIASACYMENLQILTGIAKYTANFTPPTQTQGRSYQAED